MLILLSVWRTDRRSSKFTTHGERITPDDAGPLTSCCHQCQACGA